MNDFHCLGEYFPVKRTRSQRYVVRQRRYNICHSFWNAEESRFWGRGLRLDDTDWALLLLPERDARITNNQLAADVGLSAVACHARVRKLEACGAIEAYCAMLNWRMLGATFDAWAEIAVEAGGSERFVAFLVVLGVFGGLTRLLSGEGAVVADHEKALAAAGAVLEFERLATDWADPEAEAFYVAIPNAVVLFRCGAGRRR